MIGNIFISSEISEKDFESLLENFSFPLTKAEVLYRVKMVGVPSSLLTILKSLPSRFYRSKNELVNQCVLRKVCGTIQCILH